MRNAKCGIETAQRVVREFGTSDVFLIALKAGVQIVYESWYPTTIGEFEKNVKTIRVNLRALENNKNAAQLEKIIIAHELGHFFALDLKLEGKDEEVFARDFAQGLVGNAD